MMYQHPSHVLSLVGRRNAILVALSLPLAFAQCADEGARTREDSDGTRDPREPAAEVTAATSSDDDDDPSTEVHP